MPLFPKTRVRRVLLAIFAAVVVIVVVLVASTGWFDTLGAAPTGERLARIERSPHYRNGAFQNPEATSVGEPGSTWRSLTQWLGGHEQRVPPGPMPIVKLTKADFATPPASGLRATWLGHSSVLVEIDGARILFDPVWAPRASPSSLVGPKRFHEPPLALDDLPPIDVVVASHDHYDHLDRDVVRAIARSPSQSRTRFVVPLGVGAHLEKWGIAPDRITELDWSESTTVGALTFTATPARHFFEKSGMSARPPISPASPWPLVHAVPRTSPVARSAAITHSGRHSPSLAPSIASFTAATRDPSPVSPTSARHMAPST